MLIPKSGLDRHKRGAVKCDIYRRRGYRLQWRTTHAAEFAPLDRRGRSPCSGDSRSGLSSHSQERIVNMENPFPASNPRLWNDSVFAEVGEEAFEHVLRIDAVMETSTARLDGARDVVVFHETENGVSEGPRRNLFVG